MNTKFFLCLNSLSFLISEHDLIILTVREAWWFLMRLQYRRGSCLCCWLAIANAQLSSDSAGFGEIRLSIGLQMANPPLINQAKYVLLTTMPDCQSDAMASVCYWKLSTVTGTLTPIWLHQIFPWWYWLMGSNSEFKRNLMTVYTCQSGLLNSLLNG